MELRVEATDGTEILTTVVEGGEIGEHKGINAPGIPLPASAITPKDVDDLKFGLSLGVDMVAISFVQSAADLREARQSDGRRARMCRWSRSSNGRRRSIISTRFWRRATRSWWPAAISGSRCRSSACPARRRRSRAARRRHGIPVIVATQVLESMTTEPRPTRAEVNDAANAVEDGVDAIMLAGETAVGAFAARAVQTLDAIIRDAEATPPTEWSMRKQDHGSTDHAQAICEAAVTLANRGDAQAIVAVTRGGGTARRLSALRPRAPIIATTDRDDTARRLALFWGVFPVCTDIGENVDSAGALVSEQLVARGLVARGAAIVLVNISADLARADANYLKIQRL